ADIADGSAPAFSHDWGYTAEDSGVALPRARLVGGCSATNAGMMLRGRPADYDGWGPGWSYADLLPVFQAVEADPLHGTSGPIPVHRDGPDALTPLQRAFHDAALAAGHPAVDDHNRVGAAGVGPMPRNVRA